ncbi:uncharacterized protein JCM6883_004411 [Sporobolomyces salmoneus]|uniref:uncharacterized protein n=1 Tax=Sporobolomyces salmoneus TaxID=183962 RepID=UPI0031788319
MLHPNTLSCVPTLKLKTGRKAEDLFVASLVKPMNDYLLHLDSTTTTSRDRNVRKSAREARDAYIAEKQKSVEAGPRDQEKILKWQVAYQAAQKRIKAELKAARIQQRVDHHRVRARMLSLGYLAEDLTWISRHGLVGLDKPLEESDWNAMSGALKAIAEAKQRVRGIQQRDADEARLVNTYYARCDRTTSTEKFRLQHFYKLYDFKNLLEVKRLVSANAAVGSTLWNETLPTLERILAQKRLAVKLAYARHLARAYSAAGRPLSADFLSALFPLGGSQIGAFGWKVNLDFPNSLVDHSTALENQLDELFSRFTSQIFCGHSNVTELSLSQISKSQDPRIDLITPGFQRCHSSKGSCMTFAQLLNHVSQSVVHSRAFNPHYAENPHPVSAIAYVPQSTVSNATSTSS